MMTGIGNFRIIRMYESGWDVYRLGEDPAHHHWHFPTEKEALDFIDAENAKEAEQAAYTRKMCGGCLTGL